MLQEKDQIREDYQPGNLGFDPLGLFPSDKAAQLVSHSSMHIVPC